MIKFSEIKTMERERDTIRRQLIADQEEIEHWRTQMLTITHDLDHLETGLVEKKDSLREYEAIISEGEKAFEKVKKSILHNSKIIKNASLLSRAVDLEAEEIQGKWRYGVKRVDLVLILIEKVKWLAVAFEKFVEIYIT
jgi:chromosome segregation ATPase